METQTEIPGKMFGLQSMLDSIDKTQRSRENLVPSPKEVVVEIDPEDIPESEEDEPSFYPSPTRRPSTEKCSKCPKISGKINDIQLAWINKLCVTYGSNAASNICIPMEISPDIPSWSKPPVLDEYLLKPLFIWHPENQFGISVARGKCPHCNKIGCLKFKQYTQPRHVECLTTDAYMISARYVCSKGLGGCAKTFAISDEDLVSKSNIIPASIFLKCPIQIFRKRAWKTDLVQCMFDLVSGRAKTNDFIAMLRKSRTSEYMKTACVYWDHIQYYTQLQLNRDRLTSTQSILEKYPDFPQYFAHCEGYNGTLGPSPDLSTTIFQDIVGQQRPFFDRYEGGLVGTHLSADHHHNVPGRIHFTDNFTRKNFSGIHGLHTVLNERHQIISHRWTTTTSNEERAAISNDLVKRYQDRNIDTNDIMIYLDKCYDDCAWLSSFTGIRVLLDNHHLIFRYRDNSNGTNRAQHQQFMKKIAQIITGSKREKMRPGPVIFDELTKFLLEFEELESKHERQSNRIITNRTRDCHKTQEKHFKNCITEPENALVNITDRFCKERLRRGSGKNENVWRHLRAGFPEKCGFDFGDAFMTVMVVSWNFNREMQYDPRWAYLPISPMHIILTQHVALWPKDKLASSDGISSMFQCLPLAIDDCMNNFGLSKSFADAITPALPSLPQQSQDAVGRMAHSIADYAIWNSSTFDPLVQRAMDIATSIDISTAPSIDNAESSRANEDTGQPSTTGGNEASQFPHPIVTSRKCKRGVAISHVRSTLTSHKKKLGSTNAIGNRRLSAMESLAIWDSIMNLSPMFNPLERRVLRFLALHCLVHEPINSMAEFPIQGFHFPVLERIWSVIISAIRVSNFEFKEYLRPKSLQSLRQQLEDMVETDKMNLNFGPTTQTRTMVSTLQECAKKLVRMAHAPTDAPVAVARKTVTTTITQMEVVEAMIPLQHASHPMETVFEDMTAIPSIPVEMTQPEQPRVELSADKFLVSLVDKEQKIHGGSIRWKTSIAPQWKSWAIEHQRDPLTHLQLKNKSENLKKKMQRGVTDVASTTLPPPQAPQPEPAAPPAAQSSSNPINTMQTNPVPDPHAPSTSTYHEEHTNLQSCPEEQDKIDEGSDVYNMPASASAPTPIPASTPTPTTTVSKPAATTTPEMAPDDMPTDPNIFIPPRNMPSWEVLQSTQVPEAPPRTRYSAQENALYRYLLNNPSEKAKCRASSGNSVSWKKFADRWKYWCQVKTALGSLDFKLRTVEQLIQKRKDNVASEAASNMH